MSLSKPFELFLGDTVDAHFWLELDDGTIVDHLDFPQIRKIKRKGRCVGKPIYIQTKDKNFILWVEAAFIHKEYYIDRAMRKEGPIYLQCLTNSIKNQRKFGGTIRMGSLGFENDRGFLWLYGHENARNARDFNPNYYNNYNLITETYKKLGINIEEDGEELDEDSALTEVERKEIQQIVNGLFDNTQNNPSSHHHSRMDM